MTPEPFDIKKELRENEFRVSIFGSARIPKEDPIFKQAYKLAYSIADAGMDLVTGGGPGLMEAAATGHRAGDVSGEAHSIGLNIRLPFEQKPNAGLDSMNTHERFSTRLDEFMMLSNAVVVMPGGVGTCLEFFYTWQLMQVNHICKIPIILIGDMWHNLIKWVIDNPLKHGYMSSGDLDTVICIDTADEAFEIIQTAKAEFDKNGGKDVCLNWRKYGKELNK
jgi:uncharacterized protein (TIGR00730 family)